MVQNLVALTLQERSNETSNRRSEKVSQHSLYDFERSYRMNSPKTIIEEPKGSASDRKRPSMSRKISESRSEGRIWSSTSRDCDVQVSPTEGREQYHTRIRTRSKILNRTVSKLVTLTPCVCKSFKLLQATILHVNLSEKLFYDILKQSSQ